MVSQCFFISRCFPNWEDKMFLAFSTLVLASQLFMTVADNVPKYDIQRGCRADNTNTSGLSVGLDESTKNCIRDEQTAQNQLQAQWSQFAPSPGLRVHEMRLMLVVCHPATL